MMVPKPGRRPLLERRAIATLPLLLPEVGQIRREALDLPSFHDKDIAEPEVQLTTIAFLRPDGAFGHDYVLFFNHSRDDYIGVSHKGVVLDLLIESRLASRMQHARDLPLHVISQTRKDESVIGRSEARNVPFDCALILGQRHSQPEALKVARGRRRARRRQ